MGDTVQVTNGSYQKVNNLMWQVVKQMNRLRKRDLEQFGLTCSQFEVLAAIYQISNTGQEMIQIDLSEKTQINPMSTSVILRNLQRRGFITRDRSQVNTRTVVVRITPSGEELYRKALDKVEKTVELIYQNVNEKLLLSQLLIVSDKLNKLNF